MRRLRFSVWKSNVTKAVFEVLSLASKNGFLAPSRRGPETGSHTSNLWIWETDFGVLLLPFGRGIGQPDDPYATRQPPLDCSLHQAWCQ